MQCQQCQSELLPGARYCHSCAWEVQPQCPSCRTANPPGSKFCFNCGTDLEPESLTTETSTSQTLSPPATLVCPRCHQRNDPAATYCYSCGLPLEGGTRAGMTTGIVAYTVGSPGGFWFRFLASLIDVVIITVVLMVMLPLVSGEPILEYWALPETADGDTSSFEYWMTSDSDSWEDWTFWILIALYFTVAIAIWGTTIGKRIFGLSVIRSDSSKIGVGRALARSIAYSLFLFLSLVTLGIGLIIFCLIVALRSDKRSLHDLICDTVVIRRQG